jgi:hypothetical protein
MLGHLSKILLGALLACALLSPGLTAQAAISDKPTTITLGKPVHFVAPDGSAVVTESRKYTVEQAEQWLRLIPDERRNALLIEASAVPHEEIINSPMAISLPGEEGEDADIHHVVFLLPDGQSLDAVGTYSGIRSRGLFKRVAARPRIRKAVQSVQAKVQRTVKKVVEAVPQDFIKAIRPLGPELRPLLLCLKKARQTKVSELVQQIKDNPNNFVRWKIKNIQSKMRTNFPHIMEPQIQMLRKGFSPPPTSAQIIGQAIESWKRLAKTHQGARCLVPFLTKHEPALKSAALQLETSLRQQSKHIFDTHIAPPLHKAMGKGLSKALTGKQGGVLLTKEELQAVANGVYAKYLIQQLETGTRTIQRFTGALGNQKAQSNALAKLQSALHPQAQWPELFRLELGTEIVRAMGHKYINSDKPPHGGFLINQAVGLVHLSQGTVEKLVSAICGLVPEVGAAVCAIVEVAVDAVWNQALVPGIRFAAKTGIHKGFDQVMNQAKTGLQQGKRLSDFRQSSGPLNPILTVLSKDLMNNLAETHLKDTRNALNLFNQSVLQLAHAASSR